MSEFDYAFDKLTMGVDLKSRIRSKEDLNITAYHEAGHTLVAYFTQDAMPLHKVHKNEITFMKMMTWFEYLQ